MSSGGGRKKSVALKYDYSGAPTVTAKGDGLVGQEIIQRARDANIAVVEDPALAHLLSLIPLGEEIPAELYEAVAKILVFVVRLETTFEQRA